MHFVKNFANIYKEISKWTNIENVLIAVEMTM